MEGSSSPIYKLYFHTAYVFSENHPAPNICPATRYAWKPLGGDSGVPLQRPLPWRSHEKWPPDGFQPNSKQNGVLNQKIGGFKTHPNHPIFHRVFPLFFSPSILGYSYFWKHPSRNKNFSPESRKTH